MGHWEGIRISAGRQVGLSLWRSYENYKDISLTEYIMVKTLLSFWQLLPKAS